MHRKPWCTILLSLTVTMLMACAAKPRIEIYMEPVPSREGAHVDTRTGALTAEQRGVQVTVEPLDEVELFELTKDQRINPYISVSRWGNVEPLYTVFKITVRNRDNKRVVVGDTTILINHHGEQFGSFHYDHFKELQNDKQPQTVVYQYIGYRHHYPGSHYPSYHAPYRAYNVYPDSRIINNTRLLARESIFRGSKLFPGAKRTGLLVFDRLDAGATDVSVLIPEVLITDGEGNQNKVDFEFDFHQVVSVEED